MFEQFRWGLTSGERYSTGPLTPQKRGIHCACQHFVSDRSLGGVRRSCSQITKRIALTHSTPLFFRHSSLCASALFVLDIAGDGAKAYLKAKPKLLQRRCAKGQEPGLRRYWAELHGWSFTRSCFWAGNLPQNQTSLDWAFSVSYKQEKACVFMF